jgi:hypothetical protein
MRFKLRQPDARRRYARRKVIVEPVSGQPKEDRGFAALSLRGQLDDRAGLSWGALAEYERSCQQTRSAVTLRALAGKELHLLDEFGFARCTVYESGVGSLMTIRYDRIVPALFAGAIGWHYGSANVGDGILGGVVLGFHDIGYHRELTGFLLYILLQHQVLQIEAEVGPHRKRSVH